MPSLILLGRRPPSSILTFCVIIYICYHIQYLEDEDSGWCGSTFSSVLQHTSTHDVAFKTSDGGSVSAHRVIVAAGSPVFHAMLYGNMKESSQKEIELPNIERSILKMLFYFIYTGRVKASTAKCLRLLQAADYFDIGALKTVCVRIVEKKISIFSCLQVTTFAVTHQINSLLAACLKFMELWAMYLVDCNLIDAYNEPYPLPAVILFLKSSNLKVCELDLFLAVVQWCVHQKDKLDSDDIKSIFKLIRYPLISKNDLIEKVHPTNMADPDLYKAALEYHDTDNFDGPQEQITVRKFYFDFDPVFGLVIEHTPKGTVITKSQLSTRKRTCMVEVDFEIDTTVCFIFCLKSCQDKHNTELFLTYDYDENPAFAISETVEEIPIGEEIEGRIYWHGGVRAEIGEVSLSLEEDDDCDSYCFGVTLCSGGDQISILKTY